MDSFSSVFSVAASTTRSAAATPSAMPLWVLMALRVCALSDSVSMDLAIWRSRLLPDGFQRPFQLLGLGVDEADGESFLCEDMRYAITHGTGADHGDILHMELLLPRAGGGALLGGGCIVISKSPAFPGLDEVGPGEGVEDVLRRGLAR